MKKFNIKKIISIICSVIGVIISIYGLIIGFKSIGLEASGKMGVFLIFPSIVALIIVIVDFLITLDKIKKNGLIYSWIISLFKIGFILCFIITIISNYNNLNKYRTLNFVFDFVLIITLIIFTIPSILNVIKLRKPRKK